MQRHRKNTEICWDERRKATQLKQTIHLKETTRKVLAKEGRLKTYGDSVKQYKLHIPKNKERKFFRNHFEANDGKK